MREYYKYEHQYESADYQYPITQETFDHERRFDDCYKRYNSFYRPPSTNHYPCNTNLRRDYSIFGRERGSRIRHHSDHNYSRNYDSESYNRLHIRDPMNNRHYWKNRMPPVGRSRRFIASSTRTTSQKYEIKTKGKPTLDPNVNSLLNIDDKCMETTSSVKEICAVKSLRNCANVSTDEVESRKISSANLQTSDLTGPISHTGAMRLNNNARNVLESQVIGDVNSNIKKAKNKISKHSIDIKKAIRCSFNETTRHNSSTSKYEAVEPKNSSTMTTLSDPNSLTCKTSSKIYTNIAYSDSTSTQTQSAKRKKECRKPKHSTTVTVEKCPHQKDPRLNAIVAKENEKILLKMLKWKSTRRSLNINTLDNKLVTGPVSPKDKSASSINKSSNTDHPNRPNSIHMTYRCDFKQNKSGVSDSQTSQKTKTIECNKSFRRDENCLRKDAKRKDIPINQKSVNISKYNKKTKAIMNEKFVCQCNHSVINKFCGNSFQASKFCCHVYIKKGECDLIGKSYNRTNFLDIDTRQSYLFPGNIHSISASNLEEHISENLQNESKHVAAFDKEQDEEMKFIPETVKELRNSTEDIVKNSADDTIVLADKIVPKKLFMQIYNTKPNKVSAAPLSLDKVNHKIPLNSNSEMGKREIVISPPKGSSTTLGNKIRKKLYDPVSDSNVCEKRLLELFDDDLSDLTSGSNGRFGDKVQNVTGSKFLEKSNSGRKFPFKQTSLTCEDAYVTPKKISNRRKTIYFSSFLKDTEFSKNNTPAVSCFNVTAETSPSTVMTNARNHLEQSNQLETQNNTSQGIINNLSGTSESSACASVAAETTQLIAKEIAMTDVSNHSEKIKQVDTVKNTSQDGGVSGSEISSNYVPEAYFDHDQEIIVPRNENKFLTITTSPSYISPENNLEKHSARLAPENENRQMMSELLEKEVTERDIGKTHEELEFCINLKDFKEVDQEYCVKIKTINNIHALTQMESESHNENGERNVNMKISSPFGYNDVKRKKLLSMPELEVTEHRQIKKKALKGITELTLKFATSLEEKNECYEEVMFILERPSIEPSFAVSSDVSEYLVRAVIHPNNAQSSEEAYANHKPAAPPPSQPVPNSSDQNKSQNPIIHNFYPVELGRIYYQFYDRVVYILKGYIPLQNAYSESCKIIYDTFQRFPHSYNNINHESLSLDMKIHNRRKLYSRYLLEAILKLPTDLPQFHFAHFLRLTTELLNRSCISISIPVLVHHLLAVMLACNMDYKQNKTSDKFKKNLESFFDTLNDKNGPNRPEFGMTLTQRYLLKAQIVTYLQLHQNQKICSESSKLLHHYYSRQQYYIQNANSNNIQQTFGTCQNENPTNETRHSVIQNSNQSNRSCKPMQYQNLRSILNNKSSDPPMHVPNTRNIISSSSRQPPTSSQCTSDRNNCTVMNVTIPMKPPIQTNSINSVIDKINIRKNPPVNKMTNKQVLPILPTINSSLPQSRIYAHSSSLHVIPLMTNSTVQSSSLQKLPLAKTFEDHSITNVSSGELCSINDKVNDKKTDASDTIPATKENTILVPTNCIPHISIISNENQLENNSISKDQPVGPSRMNQPQSVEMTTPSTSEVLKLKTQSSGNHNSVDSNADIPYTVKKERTPLNECNIDVVIGKSSDEAKKYESSDNCVDSVGSTSLGVKIKEEIVEKISICEDEIIDLTWIDGFTEEELRKEDNGHEFMCIKNEPSVTCTEVPSSPEDSGIDSPPIQMEYPMLILENRMCLCGKMAIYLCHCNTAMYCSQQCQLTDWPKHRKGCHSSCAT